MSIETNLQGRLRNTYLPYNHGLLPLFEAVVNSIHSIEEAEVAPRDGCITVEIIRDTQQGLDLKSDSKKRGPDAYRDIVGFEVIDNGIGFTEPNMLSFLTLDSDYKADKGGRGVGRLLWLKAFKKVSVNSIYRDTDSKLKRREFNFTSAQGVADDQKADVPADTQRRTRVHLEDLGQKYREASYKSSRAIANSLFEHCLWYFVREGGAPNIVVMDGDEQIKLYDIYEEHMVSSAETECITMKDKIFDLTHIKLRAISRHAHIVALCAANRVVKEENLTGKIPGLYGTLGDEDGNFVYACYVTSSFLDETVRSERTGFDIVESPGELFAETEISLSEIREAVIAKASGYLSKYLEENKAKARERIECFVSQRAPRYRPILARIPEEKMFINPDISDRDLDLALHKCLSEIEEQLLTTGHDVMNPKEGEEFLDYQNRLQEYLKTAEDIKKSDLANYIFHRRVILDLLTKAIQRDQQGQYFRENLIHCLIMPMRKDTTELKFEGLNLWLIDERLAFHDYLASDKTIASMPITGSDEKKEPDICSLYVMDKPLLFSEEERPPFASLTIIEIKRPMRNDMSVGEDKDPIEQCLGYLQRIRDGNITTRNGRPLGNPQDLPGYCYIICDLTPTMMNRCKIHDLTITSDGLGYFGYNKSFKAYIEVLSFDRLVNAATQRNRTFFDKLGLPTK